MSSSLVEPKRGRDLGRVVVELEVVNFADRLAAREGRLADDAIRRHTCEALVDSGATYLCLPTRLIRDLGLTAERTRRVRTANGTVERTVFSAVHVRVQDRECLTEVMELPQESPVLLGQIPLELMDWWIDLTNQCLVGNPQHDGKWEAEAY